MESCQLGKLIWALVSKVLLEANYIGIENLSDWP